MALYRQVAVFNGHTTTSDTNQAVFSRKQSPSAEAQFRCDLCGPE